MQKKSEFDLSFHFQPQTPWPGSLPVVAIGPYLIAGFNMPDDSPVYTHPLQDIAANTKVFAELHPQLTLPEIARLTNIPHFSQVLSESELLKAFGYHLSSELRQILKLISQLPFKFQTWLSTKKVGVQELAPLLNLTADQRSFISDEILLVSDSKTEAMMRLELLSDLILMGVPPAELSGKSVTELKKQRYPQTATRDQRISQFNLGWPKAVRSQFSRRGDKGGFDVHFFAGTPVELAKTAQTLVKVAEEWNSNLEKNL